MEKISLLTSEFTPFRGGIGVVASELAYAAVALGVKVDVIAPNYLRSDLLEVDASYPFRVKRYRAGAYSGRWVTEYIRQAVITARDPNAGRIIAVDCPFLEALALTRLLHGVQFDAILHGSEITRASRSWLRRVIGLKRIYDSPEKYVAVSEFTRRLMLKHMPFINADKVITSHLAANASWFAEPNISLCKDVVGSYNGSLIVCTGRITPRKGQLTLMRALQSAPIDTCTRENLIVVIAGRANGADKQYFDQVVREAKNLKAIKVVIRDDLDNETVRALYSVADIFCLPGSDETSAVEGFGLVFVEAAAQGLPSVAGAVGAVRESVLDGRTGVLVPPDQPVELGQTLAELLADRERLKLLSEAAKLHAAEFSWEAFARPFLNAQ